MIPRKGDQVSRISLQSRKHFPQELQNDITDIFDRKILNCIHLLLSFLLVVLQFWSHC